MENKAFCRKNVIKEFEEKIEMYEKSKIVLKNEIDNLRKKINNRKMYTNILNAIVLVCIYLANKNLGSVVLINLVNIYKLVIVGCFSVLCVNTYKYFKDTKNMRDSKNEKVEEIKYLNDEINYLKYINSEMEKEIEPDNSVLSNCEDKVKKLILKKKK